MQKKTRYYNQKPAETRVSTIRSSKTSDTGIIRNRM